MNVSRKTPTAKIVSVREIQLARGRWEFHDQRQQLQRINTRRLPISSHLFHCTARTTGFISMGLPSDRGQSFNFPMTVHALISHPEPSCTLDQHKPRGADGERAPGAALNTGLNLNKILRRPRDEWSTASQRQFIPPFLHLSLIHNPGTCCHPGFITTKY